MLPSDRRVPTRIDIVPTLTMSADEESSRFYGR